MKLRNLLKNRPDSFDSHSGYALDIHRGGQDKDHGRNDGAGDESNPEISLLTDDSRMVEPGCIYSMTPAAESFLEDAIARGSSAILVRPEQWERLSSSDRFKGIPGPGPLFLVTDRLLEWQGYISAKLNGDPSRMLFVSGITGTNGKTSTAWILYHVWQELGVRAGMIGTLGAWWVDESGAPVRIKTGYTTPRAFELQRLLKQMQDDGVTHVVLESSSEALALGRLEGMHFSSVGFTNLSEDHLDYHNSMEHYFQAKMHLLRMASHTVDRDRGSIVIHRSNEFTERAFQEISSLRPDIIGLKSGDGIDVSLPGQFNRINAAIAYHISGMKHRGDDLFAAFQQVPPVPGRFNLLPWNRHSNTKEQFVFEAGGRLPDRCVIIDYAHTPDALENILREIRSSGAKTIVTVFGCGGDRDRMKRPHMGSISVQYSNCVIVTDDNPRNENPDSIRQEVLRGARSNQASKGCELRENGGRREAIREGIGLVDRLAAESLPAVLLIAGKGHETVQIAGNRTYEFSDYDVFLEEMNALHGTAYGGRQV